MASEELRQWTRELSNYRKPTDIIHLVEDQVCKMVPTERSSVEHVSFTLEYRHHAWVGDRPIAILANGLQEGAHGPRRIAAISQTYDS